MDESTLLVARPDEYRQPAIIATRDFALPANNV